MAKGKKTGGRARGVPNRATREVKDLAGAYTAAAMKELGRLATKAKSEQARVAAIKEIFDRAYGRAPQALHHSGAIGSYDLTRLSDEKLKSLAAILGAAVTGGGAGGDRTPGG